MDKWLGALDYFTRGNWVDKWLGALEYFTEYRVTITWK